MICQAARPWICSSCPAAGGRAASCSNEPVVGWVRDRAGTVELAASVCTGSFILGQAGLLDGRRATTHWQSLDRMAQTYPAIEVVRDLHIVDDGSILTSAGISAGIDLALRVVAGSTAIRSPARRPGIWNMTTHRRTRGGFDRIHHPGSSSATAMRPTSDSSIVTGTCWPRLKTWLVRYPSGPGSE